MKKDDLSELESLNSVMDLSGIAVAMMNQENILQEISDHEEGRILTCSEHKD